jgi:hypothetical protein
VRFGSLRLARLELTPPTTKAPATKVMLAGKPLQHRLETRDGRLAIILSQPITLTAGQILKVIV